MTWIVLGEEKNQLIKLASSSGTPGILPKGSYLTVLENGTGNPQYILRVEGSSTEFPYSPSSFIVDQDLEGISADLKWQNIIHARVVKDLDERDDGLINPVLPRQKARRSKQEEIELAMEHSNVSDGPQVFLATVHDSKNQILIDEEKNYLYTHLDPDFFFHQTLVVGKTGSGKTVSTKYLAQYFVEEMEGAVLAVNVKDVDFLKMDMASNVVDDQIRKEWDILGKEEHGLDNFIVYYPSTTKIPSTSGVTMSKTRAISLDVKTIDPDALTGLLRNITDMAADALPKIFNYWRESEKSKGRGENITFGAFVDWVTKIHGLKEGKDHFYALYSTGEAEIILAHGTVENILRNLNSAREFFDQPEDTILNPSDVVTPGMMSVINLEDEKAKAFGSVLLRHLLHQIVEMKSSGASKVPVLIIIDEVHQFYNTSSSREALGDLDTICRQGRSQKIGVIFSSQTPGDIPSGLTNVINTKLVFKSDAHAVKSQGLSLSDSEIQTLKKGFAAVSIHDMPQLKIVKFPLSYGGVIK